MEHALAGSDTKSPCKSTRHNEYSCLIKWGVSSKKFGVDKWCEGCKEHHNKTYIVQEYIKNMTANEPKKKKRK